MQEIIHCPSCQRKLQVPETLLGQDVQCPTCSATFVASLGGGTRPSAMPPQRPSEPPFSFADRDADQSYRQRDYARTDDYDDYGDEEDDDRRRRHPPRRRDLGPHRGSTILTLGILSLVLPSVGLVLGIMAWVMGSQDYKEIRAGRMDPEGESATTTGKICGMIATILHCAGLLLCFLWFCVFFGWTARL